MALDDLSEREPMALRALIGRGRVVVFRDQTLDDCAFVKALSNLGEMMFTDGETPVPGSPELNLVTNVGRARTPRSVFHTDTSYVSRPPAFTALRAVEVPKSGGATLFSDQVAALRSLPARVQSWLSGRTLRHAYGTEALPEEECWHPALRRHPETGEAALYLSTPERCDAFSDADCDMSRRIIALLYRRSCRASRLYRHDWQSGDVVIWDDRLTLHRADHSAVVGARTFHRGMVRGERPIAA